MTNSTSSARPTADAEPLRSKLSAYREKSSQLRPDFARAYDDLVNRLSALDRGEVGPKAGEPMPPFMLPAETGRFLSLSRCCNPGRW